MRGDGLTTIRQGGFVQEAGGATINAGGLVADTGVTVTTGGILVEEGGAQVQRGGLAVDEDGAFIQTTADSGDALLVQAKSEFYGNGSVLDIRATNAPPSADYNLLTVARGSEELLRVAGDGHTYVSEDMTIGTGREDALNITSTIQGETPLVFEGDTEDDFELSFSIATLTDDRTVTFPDLSGTVVLSDGPSPVFVTGGRVASRCCVYDSLCVVCSLLLWLLFPRLFLLLFPCPCRPNRSAGRRPHSVRPEQHPDNL